MHTLKWLVKRFGFLKRILFEWFDACIYQPKSRFLLHSWNAHRTPYEAILFYTLLGRMIFAGHAFLALYFKKILKKKILIEGFDTDLQSLHVRYERGDYDLLWPKSPMIGDVSYLLDDAYCLKIENSLLLSYQNNTDTFDKTAEWERIATLIKTHFFDHLGKVIKSRLSDFRADPLLYQSLFNDQFGYIDPHEGYLKSYLKSVDLVLEYHRSAFVIDPALLASLHESPAGNNLCAQYRGQRISEKTLFYAHITGDLIKGAHLAPHERKLIVDIGSGYGGLARMLYYYFHNSCFVLLDLPETLVLTAYFIRYNFPHAKIALLEDIASRLDDFEMLVKEYDFILIPPHILTSMHDKSVDLVINSASMGFMQEEYLTFYLTQIDRILKSGGYFYALNKSHDDQWGIGMHGWDFGTSYLTRSLRVNNRFSYPQWLGQKIEPSDERCF